MEHLEIVSSQIKLRQYFAALHSIWKCTLICAYSQPVQWTGWLWNSVHMPRQNNEKETKTELRVGWKVTLWMGPNQFHASLFDLMNLTYWKMPKYSLHWKATYWILPNYLYYENCQNTYVVDKAVGMEAEVACCVFVGQTFFIHYWSTYERVKKKLFVSYGQNFSWRYPVSSFFLYDMMESKRYQSTVPSDKR